MERLWAPWRLSYVTQTGPKRPGCFFCHAWQERDRREEHLALAHGRYAFVMMNRFPYNSGHLMVATARHIGEMEEVNADEAQELWHLMVLCKTILRDRLKPDGFNVGINQGGCAGAGVTDHLHIHIVPRWHGDTNFMPVLADTKVLPQALEAGYRELRSAFEAWEKGKDGVT